VESVQRIEELLKQLNEYCELKNKLTKDNTEFFRRNASIEFEVQQLTLNNKRLNQEFDDARLQLENELLVRRALFYYNNFSSKNYQVLRSSCSCCCCSLANLSNLAFAAL
jgi:hypothetical protein